MDTQINDNGPEVNGQQQLEEYSFLDKSSLEKALICNRCSRHLNVFPILYNENIGNICGRCSSDATLGDLGPVLRLQVYEDFIKNLIFPCVNKNYGCVEVLKFDDVLSHEKHCRFQCMNCPLFYKHLFPEKVCSWTGSTKLLCDHLKSHPDSFLDPPQFEWPQDGKNMFFFTTVGNQVITVVIKYEKLSKYVCLVMVNGTELDSQCFRYQLELTDEDNSNSIILRRNQLEPLSDFVETLRYSEKMLEVDVDRISEIFQNSKKVFAKFNIIKKSKNEIIQITGVKDGDMLSQGSSITATKIKSTPPDYELLAELECPVCKEFMLPPIYICTSGHSICNDCKTQVQACPSCRDRISHGRNYTLEKLTEKVKYPCRNREIGCSFVTTSDKIRQHQRHCKLSEHPCILECGWKGPTPSLVNHLLHGHTNLLLEHNTPILKDLRPEVPWGHYFLYVMGEMFCLTFKPSSSFASWDRYNIRFNIQHVGYLELEPKYKYTMQFSPVPESFCPCITITNFCQTWNNNLEESLGPGSVCIAEDLLKDYLVQNHLCYIKINITEVC